MRTTIAVSALLMVTGSTANADIAKKDLRSAVLPGEQFLALCALRDGSAASVALVQGDQLSGFYLDGWLTPHGSSGALSKEAQRTRFDRCRRGAVDGAAVMLVVALDPSVYAATKDEVRRFSEKKGGGDYLGLVISIGQIAGLDLPTGLTSPFEYTKEAAARNGGTSRNGSQWPWQPSAMRLVEIAEPPNAIEPAEPPSSPSRNAAGERIPTGLKGVPFVERTALLRLYQALADAEDYPNVSYDVELRVLGDVVSDVWVHPVEMMRDAPIDRGDSVCVFSNADVGSVDLIELLNALLHRGSSAAEATSSTWGFAAGHPLLGTPQAWQAAVTSPAACYLTATTTATAVALAPTTPGMRYAATLVRGIARYPGGPAAFNAKAPLQLSTPSASADLGRQQRAWMMYRSFVAQTRIAAKLRAEAFTGLSSGEIAKRRAYARETARLADQARAIRAFVRLREIGWHEYQANRYKGMQDDVVNRYASGASTLFDVASANAKMLTNTDIGPALVAQTKTYKTFMTTSVLSKRQVAEDVNPAMTTRGRICDIVPFHCLEIETRVKPSEGSSIQWELGDVKRSDFASTLGVGQVVLGPANTLEAAFGADPANGECVAQAEAQSPARIGPQKIELRITNTGAKERRLSLASVGSWTRAQWKELDEGSAYVATIGPGATRIVEIDFALALGYEDLNAVYVIENGALQSELVLDYWVSLESPLRVIEVDSGGVESGTDRDYGTYDIAVGKVPSSYRMRRACVWLSGDRTRCKNYHADCKWKSTSDDNVAAQFALQGHDEGGASRRMSTGHLRVVYQLMGEPLTLR